MKIYTLYWVNWKQSIASNFAKCFFRNSLLEIMKSFFFYYRCYFVTILFLLAANKNNLDPSAPGIQTSKNGGGESGNKGGVDPSAPGSSNKKKKNGEKKNTKKLRCVVKRWEKLKFKKIIVNRDLHWSGYYYFLSILHFIDAPFFLPVSKTKSTSSSSKYSARSNKTKTVSRSALRRKNTLRKIRRSRRRKYRRTRNLNQDLMFGKKSV